MTTDRKQHQELDRALREYSRSQRSKQLSTRGYDAWAREHGKPRLWRVWREGTWAERTREAGLQPRQEWRWERDELLALVRAVAEHLGRGPFQREYNELRAAVHPTAPAANSIVRRLGIGWPEINALALDGTDLEYSERYRRAPVRRRRANVARQRVRNRGAHATGRSRPGNTAAGRR